MNFDSLALESDSQSVWNFLPMGPGVTRLRGPTWGQGMGTEVEREAKQGAVELCHSGLPGLKQSPCLGFICSPFTYQLRLHVLRMAPTLVITSLQSRASLQLLSVRSCLSPAGLEAPEGRPCI